MAKGLRASTEKANRSKLRSRVFGPLEEARKDRLSAKLLELAAQPKAMFREDIPMTTGDDATKNSSKRDLTPNDQATSDAQVMDIDNGKATNTKSVNGSHGRIQKKGRGKARAAMVFPVYKKGRRTGPRLSAKRRKQSLKPK